MKFNAIRTELGIINELRVSSLEKHISEVPIDKDKMKQYMMTYIPALSNGKDKNNDPIHMTSQEVYKWYAVHKKGTVIDDRLKEIIDQACQGENVVRGNDERITAEKAAIKQKELNHFQNTSIRKKKVI
jgi:hypothetical protein